MEVKCLDGFVRNLVVMDELCVRSQGSIFSRKQDIPVFDFREVLVSVGEALNDPGSLQIDEDGTIIRR